MSSGDTSAQSPTSLPAQTEYHCGLRRTTSECINKTCSDRASAANTLRASGCVQRRTITLAPSSWAIEAERSSEALSSTHTSSERPRVFLKIAGIERWRKVALFQLVTPTNKSTALLIMYGALCWMSPFQSDGQSPAHPVPPAHLTLHAAIPRRVPCE